MQSVRWMRLVRETAYAAFLFLVIVPALLTGCAEPSSEADPNTPAVAEEIPITTESERARELFLAGRAAMESGNERKARELLNQAAAEDSAFALAHLQAGLLSESFPEFRRHLDAAEASAERASDGEQRLIAIYATFLGNDTEKRLDLSEELVERYPNSPRAWLTLAGVLGDLNRSEEARDALRRAIALDPNIPMAYTMLGFQYLFSEPKDFAKAEANMRRFIELRPELGKGYEYLGDVKRAQGKLEFASATYQRAVEMDPENAIAALKVGHINSFLGNYSEARRAYDAALAVADEDVRPTYANYRAFTSIHEGDVDAAQAELSGIVDAIDDLSIPADKKQNAKAFTLYNQAMIALHYDRLEEAEGILAERNAVIRAIGREVGSTEVQRSQEADILIWQGRLAARRGDYDEAVGLADEYMELVAADKSPRKLEPYHELLGLISLKKEDYLEAARQFRKANLNSVYVKYQLGLAEEGAGNEEAAREIFREVSEWNFNSVGYALVRQETMRKYREMES